MKYDAAYLRYGALSVGKGIYWDMNFIRKSSWVKVVAAVLAFSFLAEIGSPSIAWALTSGPAQPEFSSFEPVTTTNMVDPFTGAFTYNLPVIDVPGPNGGGYAISMSYHSGVKQEEESSWCGLGWTLNPGAINRQLNGFPDDYDGNQVKYYQKSKPNRTITVSGLKDVEIMGGPTLNFSHGIRYNNYSGFAGTMSTGVSFMDGLASLNVSADSDGQRGYSAGISAGGLLQKLNKAHLNKRQKTINDNMPELNADEKDRKINRAERNFNRRSLANRALSTVGNFMPTNISNNTSFPTASTEMTGFSTSFMVSAQADPVIVNIGSETGLSASFSSRRPKKSSYSVGAHGAMYPTNNNALSLNDFSYEKEGTFDKRDVMLPIPYTNKDVFGVTGEGVLGGFKVHQRNLGHNKPRELRQIFPQGEAGFEGAAGLDVTAGFNISGAMQLLNSGTWKFEGNTSNYEYKKDGDEPFFFRFGNDLGGDVRFTTNDSPIQARVVRHPSAGPFDDLDDDLINYHPKIDGLAKSLNKERSNRSTSIEYHTNNDVNREVMGAGQADGNIIHYNAFSKGDDFYESNKTINRNQSQVSGSGLAEFATTNNNGSKYIYGLPVYAFDEYSVSYSTNPDQHPENNKVIYNMEVDGNPDNNTAEGKGVKFMEGQRMEDAYASTFLLTEIHTPDYIDRTFDGPTNDDFGGWTKFNYERAAGTDQKKFETDIEKEVQRQAWFHWRAPYRGMAYSRNSLSDRRDDRGTITAGYKELFFMKSIETKTHVAFFVTNKSVNEATHADGTNLDLLLKGSGVDRKDAAEAPDEKDALNPNFRNAMGDLVQRKLERIVLFAKNDEGQLVGKPLKVVNLEYDYSLCKGVPNNQDYVYSADENYEPLDETGKLTLKKLWFEYEGITPARIRPYEFNYEYKPKEEFGTKLKSKYPEIANYGHFNSDPNEVGLKENPNYNPYQTDGWGNIRSSGLQRELNMQPWVEQKSADRSFDPAAWNLKGITLPSGGEILVNYEEHEYVTVMNRKAAQMVSLNDNKFDVSLQDGLEERFRLNHSKDLDLDKDGDGTVSKEEFDSYAAEANAYIQSNGGLYFKILYKLKEDPLDLGGTPGIGDCNTEYITGYVNAEVVVVSIPTSGGEHTYELWVETKGKNYQIPRQVCVDFYDKNRSGFALSKSCYNSANGHLENLLGGGLEAVKLMFRVLVETGTPSIGFDAITNLTSCLSMSNANSYFRLPVPIRKKGGGIRVKRILMYDKGIENGADEVLYGTEYAYKNLDGTCSGVASNEPQNIREENTLIQSFDKRDEADFKAKVRAILFGPDRDQFEGPYGELSLPPASIGYSSVISQNIHSGKTSPGFQQQAFHTYAEDQLSLVEPHFLKYTNIKIEDDILPFIGIMGSGKGRRRTWASQGFAFIQHDLHGKIKEVNQFAGFYDGIKESVESYVKQSYTNYTYSLPTDKLDVLQPNGSILSGQSIGVEEEITMAMSEVRDKYLDNGAEFDAGVTTTYPVFIFNMSLMVFFKDNFASHARHVITKQIKYTSVLLSTESMADGIVHKTENLVFDANTGKPVVVRTSDGYDGREIASVATKHVGKYINYTIPAAHVYHQMGQKAQNDRFEIETPISLYGDCVTPMTKVPWLGGDPVCQQENSFVSLTSNTQPLLDAATKGRLVEGDLIELSVGDNKALFYISEIDLHFKNRMGLQSLSIVENDLVDQKGMAHYDRLRVIESGYSNQLDATTASLTTYGEESYIAGGIIERTEENEIKLKDGLTHVVAAAVTAYSDDWYSYQATQHYDDLDIDCESPKSFEKGSKGRWRPKYSYVYKSGVVQSSAEGDDGIYKGGTYTLADGFVFKENPEDAYSNLSSNSGEFTNEPTQQAAWVMTNQVNMYSPHGEPLEEENALGIKSTAKFGYGENVPVLVAANAPFRSCDFRSFEDEEARFLSTEKAHSGFKSMKINTGKSIKVTEVEAAASGNGNTMDVKFWCHAPDYVLENIEATTSVTLTSDVFGSQQAPVKQVTRVGEWILLEAQVANLKLAETEPSITRLFVNETEERGRGPGIVYTVTINNTSKKSIYVDDVRVQPLEAEMTTYVYDPENLRLLASFDDQHFGLFYQYNAEGQLVRKLIETERGIKTVTETQYHVPSQARPQN